MVAVYDILRLIRRIVPHRKAAVNGEDILFWIGASIFIFRIIYQLNDGKIRSFGIFCMLIGMLVYRFTISNTLVELLYKVIGTSLLKFVKILKKGLKKALRPFKMGIRKINYMCRKRKNEEKHENGQADKEGY